MSRYSKTRYLENKYLTVDYKCNSEERIITIRAKNINIDGSKDDKFATFIFKSNKFTLGEDNVTIIKISINKFFNYFFYNSNCTIHVHDVDDVIITTCNNIIIK